MKFSKSFWQNYRKQKARQANARQRAQNRPYKVVVFHDATGQGLTGDVIEVKRFANYTDAEQYRDGYNNDKSNNLFAYIDY